MDNYTYKHDNFFIAYNNNNQYVAYSIFTGTTSSYASEFLSYEYGNKAVVVFGKGGSVNNLWHHLTYNALDDCWIPLTLMEEEGYRSNIMAGGKTALLLTVNGYLFAFDPFKRPVFIEEKELTHSQYPDRFQLLQNIPNPFNLSTTIKFSLPKSELVRIEVFNIAGQKINTILNKSLTAGNHEQEFSGHNLSSGIYLYRIIAGKFQNVKKMILLK